MAADKPKPTLADYVTIVMSPALIITMIVSLVFFLLTILYYGDFTERLHYILFFFVFGMVLVARISMEAGLSERALLYGIVLAVGAWFGMGSFVSYSPETAAASWLINAGLIGLAWWLSHQLTHSCTYIDEKAENTGTGVLQAAGLDQEPGLAAHHHPHTQEEHDHAAERSWWERWRRFRAERKKKQPPGVWVVYFALGALPIFGLGQALIDVADVERRSYTFWLMTLYVASALGLLVTTAFLGLRRYLRQRRLEMPKLVTTAWLGLGAALLIALQLIGALLPRPQAEFSVLSLARVGSKEQAASKFAVGERDAGKGDGRKGRQEQDPDGDPAKGKNGAGKEGKGRAKEGDAKDNQKGAGNDSGKKDGAGRDAKGSKKDVGGDADKKGGDDGAKLDQQHVPPDQAIRPATDWLAKAATALKWLVFALIALITVVVVLRGGLRYLANFTQWARRLLEALRRFWERLFRQLTRTSPTAMGSAAVPRARRVPFAAFANPFQNGMAARMTPAKLVGYSFEALEAWAAERDLGRKPDETPLEFAHRLADAESLLNKEVKHLGAIYACVLYSASDLPPGWRGTLEGIWPQLEAQAETDNLAVHDGDL